MIRSFRCSATRALFTGGKSLRWSNIKSVAERKLSNLDAARSLQDMRSPPGNRLERLSGGRAGQYSIRINDQWRICFVWGPEGPECVEIVDYH